MYVLYSSSRVLVNNLSRWSFTKSSISLVNSSNSNASYLYARKLKNCVYFSSDLDISHCFRNSLNKKIFFSLIIFSGDRKETQANFCPAIGLSSSSKSTYLEFGDPSKFNFIVTPSGLSIILIHSLII